MARPSNSERIAKLAEEKQRIEAQLAVLGARQRAERRKQETRRKIIVGGAVLAHAEHDAAFRAALSIALRASVTREADKAAISDLLTE